MLDSSLIHRGLEKKLKIMGLELYDLLSVIFLGAILNLFFGSSYIGGIISIAVPMALAIFFALIKRNKNEGFLLDYLKSKIRAEGFMAGTNAKDYQKRRTPIYAKSKSR